MTKNKFYKIIERKYKYLYNERDLIVEIMKTQLGYYILINSLADIDPICRVEAECIVRMKTLEHLREHEEQFIYKLI